MSGKAVRETLAALGVIASLVFVGTEIRQNTTATRSATQNAIYDAGRQGAFAVMANQPLMEAIVAVANDPSLLDSIDGTLDGELLSGLWNARFNEMENAYFHYRQGTLDTDPWLGFEGYIVEQARTPPFLHYWPMLRNRYGPDFRALIESVLADLAP